MLTTVGAVVAAILAAAVYAMCRVAKSYDEDLEKDHERD